MAEVFVALGGNRGQREDFLARARVELACLGRIEKISPIYETAPLGGSRRKFLNQVVKLQTNLSPVKLLAQLQKIEIKLGRLSHSKWSAREIDLDLIFYGNQVWWSDRLKIPHPEMHHRRFVLTPLADIAPKQRHPVFGFSARTLLKFCLDKLTLQKWIPPKSRN